MAWRFDGQNDYAAMAAHAALALPATGWTLGGFAYRVNQSGFGYDSLVSTARR